MVRSWEGYVDCTWCHSPENRTSEQLTEERRRALIQQTREQMGCIEGKPAYRDYVLFDDSRHRICPRRFQLGAPGLYARAYLWYDHHGTLPCAGGLLDQPAKLVHAFEVLRGALRKFERIRNEREARK